VRKCWDRDFLSANFRGEWVEREKEGVGRGLCPVGGEEEREKWRGEDEEWGEWFEERADAA